MKDQKKEQMAYVRSGVSAQRSNLVTRVHRQALEEQYLKSINSGGGLFGTSKIDLRGRKLEALGRQKSG